MKKALAVLPLVFVGLHGCSDSNTPNTPPIADAGPDQTVEERATVELDGTVSDAESDVTYTWEQLSGDDVNLNDASSLKPSFQAPSTQDDETLVFRLTATDAGGESEIDEVAITVRDRNTSSQGINEDADDRRDRANDNRRNNEDLIDNREVRSYDGANNNVSNALWGATFTHLVRMADNDYGDGISSMAGSDRVSARVVSNNVAHQDSGESLPNPFDTTDYLWQWGQFIDHDIGLTDGTEEPEDILVPSGDSFFDPSGTGISTILFSRALFDHDTGSSAANPREQENELSAWIDGGMVYGSDETRAAALRVSEDSPYLATSEGNLLPFNSAGLTNANAFGVADDQLFLAGDIRANEQIGLTTMHTLWVREHNRIAENLEDDNPTATAEEIFQAARRLVIAKIQIITYNEYLPALIGDSALSDYDGYDDTVNPGLFNEFSAAAYRYGHSLVNETLLRVDDDGDEIDDGHLALRSAFFTAPTLLTEEDSIEPILRGLSLQASQTLDTKANNDLRNFLFGQPGAGGLDLISLNIQRGRDHGVPSYNAMREALGLEAKSSFADVTSDSDLQQALAATYESVDDIDLWVGGLAEDALASEGSQMGELFRLMHILQFEALRDGDRLWYENDLTDDELRRVEDTTLAEVIRDNTGIRNEIPDNVFFLEK